MAYKNPTEYCVSCGSRYGYADETCRYCGFDPVDDEVDAKLQEEAQRAFDSAVDDKIEQHKLGED